jgi:hypothetical protein
VNRKEASEIRSSDEFLELQAKASAAYDACQKALAEISHKFPLESGYTWTLMMSGEVHSRWCGH